MTAFLEFPEKSTYISQTLILNSRWPLDRCLIYVKLQPTFAVRAQVSHLQGGQRGTP